MSIEGPPSPESEENPLSDIERKERSRIDEFSGEAKELAEAFANLSKNMQETNDDAAE